MGRHLIDQPKARTDALRLRQFLQVQRAQLPARASLALQRRMRKSEGSARTREYLRILRGSLT
ncbi:hypothetical protein OG2516_12196 [Oceanicola granulosus HTCC2516]|uniref:Uncharacterized protein n=1 Tax=Oceanicola granulosus (strain ATCC BAA-861 / DSM 15982 / KCTC 12143 / HTCC2516) TaxID=314256 RepID=Q2CD69_OCEGH|nr:hypothetical protein [Oceanicola granulosus]EAR50609.1 hypothetical protein OG2516_12196 [Oceanicola granulosus HTCC2516]